MTPSKNLYPEVIQKLLKAANTKSVKYSLENIQRVFDQLSIKLPKMIHVAGTNGKGSVSQKIQKSLQYAGYSAGLFTSPHISTFRERIRINDAMISEEDVVKFYYQIEPLAFFEHLFLIACLFFAENQVDFAVIETGLGGRKDATNIITPILSIITRVRFDHENILGNTLDEIAFEKAGIIKQNVPVVIGPGADFFPIHQKAREMSAYLTKAPRSTSLFYDDENAQIAKCALAKLGIQENKGIYSRPSCRFQILDKKVPVVLDVAHNPDAFQRLKEALQHHFPRKNVRYMVAKSLDKTYAFPGIDENRIHFVSCDHPRLGQSFEKIETLLPKLLREAEEKGEILVITGSFFIMKEARRLLGLQDPADPEVMTECYDLTLKP